MIWKILSLIFGLGSSGLIGYIIIGIMGYSCTLSRSTLMENEELPYSCKLQLEALYRTQGSSGGQVNAYQAGALNAACAKYVEKIDDLNLKILTKKKNKELNKKSDD